MQIADIQELCLENSIRLAKVAEPNQIALKTFEINIDTLKPDYTYVNIRKADDLAVRCIFDAICEKSWCGPALYTLELITALSVDEIVSRLEAYRATPNARAVSALRKNFNKAATTLYVGKVQTKFWERLIAHLGFATAPKTGGLQLYHWLYNTKSKLRVNVFVFPSNVKQLLGPLEVQIAHQLHPLIGKHS